jgi:ATP-dependent helicase IRC3
MITLRPYQTEAVQSVFAAEQRGIQRPLVALPTGTGKTIIFSHLLLQRPGRSLILVHRDELIHQAYAKLKEVDPSRSLGIVKAELDEHDAPTVIASVQTLSREARLARLTPDFRTIVVDEAHHAVAESYRCILAHCGAFSEGGPLTLGVTATPQRGDDVGLDAVFQESVYQKTIREMILAGYLADLRALRIGIKADFNSLHTRMGDFLDGELEEMLLEADAPGQIIQAYQQYANGRKALLFTPTVKIAHVMATVFQHAGVAAEALDGSTPIEERRTILKRLKRGETRILANCGVLTEGFDEPSVDCIIIARPTKSATLYTQMIGRGTRVYPGKENCLVVDLIGVTRRHDLQSVANLVGLPLDALKNGTSVYEAVTQQEELLQREVRHGQLIAKSVELFRRRPLHWLTAGRSFVLPLGDAGWIVLSAEADQAGEQWKASVVDPDGYARQLAEGLSLAYAQGTAEDYARERGAGGLVNPKAQWRQRPLSEYPKMQYMLRKLHIPHSSDITAGEASDLISVAKLGTVYCEVHGRTPWEPPRDEFLAVRARDEREK